MQETDGYGKDRRPEMEKLKTNEITITETRKKLNQRKSGKADIRIYEMSPKRCHMSMKGRISVKETF